MKKSTIKQKMDRLFYSAQHQIWQRCAVCRRSPVEIHRLIRKGRSGSCRQESGIGLCAEHHRLSPVLSAHGSPEAFKQWLADKHPETARWVEANEHRIEPSVNWETKLKEVEVWALPILEGR